MSGILITLEQKVLLSRAGWKHSSEVKLGLVKTGDYFSWSFVTAKMVEFQLPGVRAGDAEVGTLGGGRVWLKRGEEGLYEWFQGCRFIRNHSSPCNRDRAWICKQAACQCTNPYNRKCKQLSKIWEEKLENSHRISRWAAWSGPAVFRQVRFRPPGDICLETTGYHKLGCWLASNGWGVLLNILQGTGQPLW